MTRRIQMLAVAAVALLAGLLGGLTGIGGVIVVPALTELGRIPVDIAIGTTMFAFVFSGPVAALLTLRRVQLGLTAVAPLCASAALGALLGTAAIDWLPAGVMRLFVAAAATASGGYALVNPERASSGNRIPGNISMIGLGFVVGWGSAISGTGGPVMLIPILLALGVRTAAAVGLALAAHVPIVLAATIVNLASARVDLELGVILGGMLLLGTLAGVWLSGRLSGRYLTLSVAAALIGVGLWYAYATLGHK